MRLGNALRLVGAGDWSPALRPRPEPQIEAWTTSQLTAVVYADILGLDAVPVTRAEAMQVPAIARSASLLKSTISKWALRAWRGDTLVDPQPPWTLRGDTDQSWQARTAWTVDDLIFYGMSLWLAERGFDTFPLRAARVPWGQWDINADRQVTDADGKPIDPRRVVLIVGWHEGIVTFGQRSIRQAAQLELAALDTAAAPFKLELHQTTDVTLAPEEIQELVAGARAAMADHGGVLFTNSALEARDHGGAAETLYVEGRNASAVDMARLVGIPAAMIDATAAGASLTYETTQGRNQQFLDYGTSLYADPIAARLSLDDVVPAGQRVAFDTAPSTTGPAAPAVTED